MLSRLGEAVKELARSLVLASSDTINHQAEHLVDVLGVN
jgi:hypothetical protein